jgi:hypothetical protein
MHHYTCFYILVDRKPVQAQDLRQVEALILDINARRVAYDEIGDIKVCTDFLCISFDNPPLLFETLATDGKGFNFIRKYATWEEAEAGHASVVNRCRHIDKGKH